MSRACLIAVMMLMIATTRAQCASAHIATNDGRP
jgi:hypothetical protein